jgi:hypothetical protein
MKVKTLALVVVILALLSAAVTWFNRPPPPPAADPRVGQPLIDSATIDAAAGFRLTDQGRTLLLVRAPDASWLDASYHGLPADLAKLSSFAGELTDGKIQRLVTSNPERIERLGFENTKIEFLDSKGAAIWTLIVGKNAETGGRFVRFGDEPKAYLTNTSPWLDMESKDWADTILTEFTPGTIASIELSFASDPAVSLSRPRANAPWTSASTPAGKRVRPETVNTILAPLCSLHFTDTTDSADRRAISARSHARVITLTTFDGKSYVFSLGSVPDKKSPATPKPVFAFINSSDTKAPINAMMRQCAFEIEAATLTTLPSKPSDLFETAPKSVRP